MNAPVAPAAAPAATAGASLDELIFVELCGRALQVGDAATVKPDAAALAKLSITLADAYRAAHKEKMADLMPKNVGYEINMDDLAGWVKK